MIRRHIDLIGVAALLCTAAIGWASRDCAQLVFDPAGGRIGVFPRAAVRAAKTAAPACKLPHLSLPHLTVSLP